jgi:hypothetical protein
MIESEPVVEFNRMAYALSISYVEFPSCDFLAKIAQDNPLSSRTIQARIRICDPHEPDPWSGSIANSECRAPHRWIRLARD